MTRVIVQCIWRFVDVLDFYEAVDLARTLECDMWLSGTEYDENDTSSLRVCISSNEETFLLIYGNTLNLYGLVECFACDRIEPSQTQYEPEPGNYLTDRIGDIDVSVLISICNNNRQIREEEFLWFLIEFKKDRLNELTAETLNELVQDARIVVFYDISMLRFYLKIQKFPGFRLWLDNLKAILPVDFWYMLRQYNASRQRIEWSQGLPQLRYDTIDTFLEAVNR